MYHLGILQKKNSVKEYIYSNLLFNLFTSYSIVIFIILLLQRMCKNSIILKLTMCTISLLTCLLLHLFCLIRIYRQDLPLL